MRISVADTIPELLAGDCNMPEHFRHKLANSGSVAYWESDTELTTIYSDPILDKVVCVTLETDETLPSLSEIREFLQRKE